MKTNVHITHTHTIVQTIVSWEMGQPPYSRLLVFLDELENDAAEGEEEERDASEGNLVVPHPHTRRLVAQSTQSLCTTDTVWLHTAEQTHVLNSTFKLFTFSVSVYSR